MKRREALEEMATFMTKHTLGSQRGDDDDMESQSGESTTSTSDLTDVYFHRINVLMVWGGLEMGRDKDISNIERAWYTTVKFSTYICVVTCVFRLVYAHGPAFTDHMSCLATVILHIHLIYARFAVRKVFRSKAIKLILAETNLQGSTAELVQEVYFASKVLFYLGALLVPIALLLYVISWEPLYFSTLYLGPEASAFERFYGIASGILFFGGIFTHIPLLVCVHIMTSLIKLISSIACEASPDRLHPQIAALGLKRCITLRQNFFLASNRKLMNALSMQTQSLGSLKDMLSVSVEDANSGQQMPPLALSEEALRTFQEHWQNGWQLYEKVHRMLHPMQNVLLLWTATCLLVPSSLALKCYLEPDFRLDRFPEAPRYLFWLNALRVVWIWAQGCSHSGHARTTVACDLSLCRTPRGPAPPRPLLTSMLCMDCPPLEQTRLPRDRAYSHDARSHARRDDRRLDSSAALPEAPTQGFRRLRHSAPPYGADDQLAGSRDATHADCCGCPLPRLWRPMVVRSLVLHGRRIHTALGGLHAHQFLMRDLCAAPHTLTTYNHHIQLPKRCVRSRRICSVG
jgi:hypothetical protein